MSNRKVTPNQFSDGTTIDGDRLDGAIQDIGNRINHVPYGDLGVRYTQSQIVMGWHALQYQINENQAPWLRYRNVAADVEGTGDPVHKYRVKGTKSSSTPWAAPGDVTYWVWTTSLFSEQSFVVDAIDMMWKTFPLPAVPPVPAQDLDPQLVFKNLDGTWMTGGALLTITIDDPQAPEQPIRESIVLQLRDLYMGSQTLGTDPAVQAIPVETMLPNFPYDNPEDLWMQRKNMQIHVPTNSRVSFTVVLDGNLYGAGPAIFQRGAPGMVVTILEPIEK